MLSLKCKALREKINVELMSLLDMMARLNKLTVIRLATTNTQNINNTTLYLTKEPNAIAKIPPFYCMLAGLLPQSDRLQMSFLMGILESHET